MPKSWFAYAECYVFEHLTQFRHIRGTLVVSCHVTVTLVQHAAVVFGVIGKSLNARVKRKPHWPKPTGKSVRQHEARTARHSMVERILAG